MKQKQLGLFALLAIGLLFSMAVVSAWSPFARNNDNLNTAISDNDFNSWKSIQESFLTRENFDALRANQDNFRGRMDGRMGGNEALRDAVEAGDYDAYALAVNNISPDAVVMSEKDFNTLVELHKARTSGDVDTWSALKADLGDSFRGAMHSIMSLGNQKGFRGHGMMGEGHEFPDGSGQGYSHQGQGMGFDQDHEDCPFMSN